MRKNILEAINSFFKSAVAVFQNNGRQIFFDNRVKFNAFTLAELLIVIGVVGIIAESTIPSLVKDFNDKVTVTTLKKAYSTVSRAYKLAEQDNGTPDNWNLVALSNPAGAVNILNTLTPYLNISKNCGSSVAGCFPAGVTYKKLNGVTDYVNIESTAYLAKAQLADGSMIAIQSWGDCSSGVCGLALIDTNGFKKPNQVGVDTFVFGIIKGGIVPFGTNLSNYYSFDLNCKDKTTANGWGCTGWVLYNENLDYLKCNDLGWSTKSKCS